MKPVLQSKLYAQNAIHNGNCLAACLASILELPLWMVPPFEDMFGRNDHTARVVEWLSTAHKMDYLWEQDHPWDNGEVPEFYIAVGRSPRDLSISHATVWSKGKMVWDPHYSGDGIVAVDSIYYMVPQDPVYPEEWKQLMDFYSVSEPKGLVHEMELHIEKLQSQLRGTHTTAFQRTPREG